MIYKTNSMEDLNELPILGEEDMDSKINCSTCLEEAKKISEVVIHIPLIPEETLTITDEDGKVYEFEKPEFECELLGIERDLIIGWVKDSQGYLFAYSWCKTNGLDNISTSSNDFNLTPIKQWFEDESNFPALMYNKTDNEYRVLKFGDRIPRYEYWELATQTERNSLYCRDK